MPVDGVELEPKFANELAGVLVRDRQKAARSGGLSSTTNTSLYHPRRGILIEQCGAALEEVDVLTFIRATRIVYDVAFTGRINGGSVNLSGNASDIDIGAGDEPAAIAVELNTLYGLSAPNLIDVYAWPGRWLIRFPESFATDPMLSINDDNIAGSGEAHMEIVPWDVRNTPIKAMFAGTMQGETVLVGRMVVVHQWDDFTVFTLLDGCPEFETPEAAALGGAIGGGI